MLASAILSVCLAATPVADAQLKLAAPGLGTVGLDEKMGAFLSEHVAQRLKLAGAEVVTQREMAALLGIERQKELLGCSEAASSCMAELASALGADGLIMGDIAKVGGRIVINLKIISSRDGKTLDAFSDSVSTEESALMAITRAAPQLAQRAASTLHRSLHPKFEARPSVRPWAALPLGAGAAFGGAGAVLLAISGQTYQQLASGQPATAADGRALRSAGELQQGLGVAGLITGGVALVVGAGVLLLGGPSQPADAPAAPSQVNTLSWDFP